MFALHETTRKRTCRTAFFALCLAPTCATAAWIADHHLPWRAAAAARRLSDRYHLDVTLADWQDPRPSMTRLAGVTLAAPGVAAPLLKLTGVESHRRGDTLILSVNELTLAIADLPALAARLEWSFGRTAAAKIELHVQRLALQPVGDAPPLTLHQLKGIVERDQERRPRVRLLAHLDGRARLLPSRDVSSEPTEPTAQQELRPPMIGLSIETIAASDDKSAPRPVITLNTQKNAIPVALLAPLVPGMAAVNDDATFTGVVTWHAAAGDLRGRLDDVDLAQVLPQKSPHSLTGRAAVELTDCRWQGEQFQRLVGTFTATEAVANGSLLIAVRAYLGSPIDDTFKNLQAAAARVIARQPITAEDVAVAAEKYELNHLACRFDLDAAGLAIEPLIPAASTLPAGTLAASKDSPLLFCPPLKPPAKLPAVAWLQFIASPPGAWIPFTPEILETARRLPLPQ
jgi:hypothetical protein